MKNLFLAVPVLVTGGAGFIGSHLVQELVSQGAQVTVLDDLSTGKLENLENIFDTITFIKGSITDTQLCIQVSAGKQYIFHVAAQVSVPDSVENPTHCFTTNVLGTLNLLQAATHNNVERFIFSSSSAVYGSQVKPCVESMDCKPESPYGHSKLIGELLCKEYSQKNGLHTVMLRYFNVFGPRQNPHGSYAAVVAKFSDCMKRNIPLTIFGNGQQRRDFIRVQIVARTNCAAALVPMKNPWEIINVASGNSVTLLQLVDMLKKEFPDFNAGINFLPARTGDIYYSQADITNLKEVLELYPPI